MLQQKSRDFMAFFLLQFTKELIRHARVGEVLESKNALKEEKDIKKMRQIIKQRQKIKPLTTSPMNDQSKEKLKILVTPPWQNQGKKKIPVISKFKHLPRPPLVKSFPRVLRIPRSKLPPRFQYLRPIPTNIQIDLEELNPLIKDPMVKIIECNGPDENIIVRGEMGTRKTNIILNKEDIDHIIKKFSETTKIPFQEGVFKVAVGKLILLAIISEVTGSKFIIKKMIYSPFFK
jgi:hypothetical protein